MKLSAAPGGEVFMQDCKTAWACLVAALALIVTFNSPGTAEVWRVIDEAWYKGWNATVAWGTPFSELWAITGDRHFDVVSALVILAIFVQRFMSTPADARRGLAFGIYTALVLYIVIKVQRALPLERASPSLVMDLHYSIQALVPWSRAKEFAGSSFPGDHATTMLVITWLWWRAGGWRMGLTAAGLTVAFTLPRFAAGAHWATDLLVGSAAVVLFAVAVLHGTPLGRWLYVVAERISDLAFGLWDQAVERFSKEGVVESPKRQLARGMCIGIADLIPGVSGGTIALVLGIYQRLLAAISRIDGELLRMLLQGRLVESLRRLDVLFVAPVGVGMILALVLFGRIVPVGVLIAEWPEMTFGLFFGLIAASIVSLLFSVDERNLSAYGWLVAGVAVGASTVFIVPASTPDALWFLFLCGILVVTAMLIPGISGAFVLLLLGKYADAVDALSRFDLGFLLPLAAGAVTGAILFARLVGWLLHHYRRRTMLTAIGIIGGSLLTVWPFQEWVYVEVGGKMRLVSSTPYLPQTLDLGVALGLLAMIVGVVVFRLLDRLASRAVENETLRAENGGA